MRRPLQCDELITLEYYTWAGLAPSGEPHRLRRVDDYRTLPRVGPRQLGMGIYRSLGVWTEPNNHVFHSLLVNFAIALGSPDERTIRIPALLGAIVASILSFWVCRQAFGWKAAAPLAAVVIFSLPYLVQYSQEARGYSWMIALLFLQLGLMYRLARQPSSIVWGAACAFTAVLTFINVVSLALDLLFPLYLAFLIYPPVPAGAQPFSPEMKLVWRRNLFVQLLAIGSVGMMFLIDRLPAVYSSMHQYGISFIGFAGYVCLFSQTVHYLFPGFLWETVAALGLVGFVMMLCRCSQRPLGVAVLAILAIGLSHFWLAGKFPYERACGYLAPLAVLGVAYLGESALARIQDTGWWQALYGGLSVASLGFAVLSLKYTINSDARAVQIPQLIESQKELVEVPAYTILSAGSDTLRSILPNDWIDPVDLIPENGVVNLVCCLPSEGEPRLLLEEGVNERMIWRRLDHPPKNQAPPTSTCRLAWQRMRIQPLCTKSDAPIKLPSLIIWRPAPDHLGLDSSAVRKHIALFGIPYLQHNARVPAKLSFFSRLIALEFIPQSTAEAEKTVEMVKEGINRFGGSACLLQPLAETGD